MIPWVNCGKSQMRDYLLPFPVIFTSGEEDRAAYTPCPFGCSVLARLVRSSETFSLSSSTYGSICGPKAQGCVSSSRFVNNFSQDYNQVSLFFFRSHLTLTLPLSLLHSLSLFPCHAASSRLIKRALVYVGHISAGVL